MWDAGNIGAFSAGESWIKNKVIFKICRVGRWLVFDHHEWLLFYDTLYIALFIA